MNSLVELLEQRIAPAVVINPQTIQWVDADGDTVQLSVSAKVDFTDPGFDPTSIFKFDVADAFDPGNENTPMTLQAVDFTSPLFNKANIDVSVITAGGNGEAEVGFINAFGNDLRKVAINGTLVAIDAGSINSRLAINTLEVGTFGTTDLDPYDLISNRSEVQGSIGKLIVHDNFYSSLVIDGGAKNDLKTATIAGSIIANDADDSMGQIFVENGKIGKLSITGSIDASLSSQDTAGLITAAKLQTVTIGGSVVGGDGDWSGALATANGHIGKVSISGDLVGGFGEYSGFINADNGKISKVDIGGSIIGGDGFNSGNVNADGKINSVTVGGNLVGGAGNASGSIYSADGGIGKAVIDGGIFGGDGELSGTVEAGSGHINKIIVGTNVEGGSGAFSGGIFATQGKLNAVDIGLAIYGGDGESSGAVRGEQINKIVVGQNVDQDSVIGGAGESSGLIFAQDKLNKAQLAGNLVGGDGMDSGLILSQGKLNFASLGNLIGGSGEGSGIVQGDMINKIVVGGDVVGGDAENSGNILSGIGGISRLTIDGDLLGGEESLTGVIWTGGVLKNGSIGGSVIGGTNPNGDVFKAGNISAGGIGKLKIAMDVVGGTVADDNNILSDAGSIRSASTINNLQIGRDIVGGNGETGENTTVVITAESNFKGNEKSDRVINSLSVAGNVDFALILGGYDANFGTNDLNGTNAHAQINKVTIGGNMVASSIASGVLPGPDGFGVGDTYIPSLTTPFSAIAKIVVGGSVSGDPGDMDAQFGFVAGDFKSVSVGGAKLDIPALGGSTPIDTNVNLHRPAI